MQETRGSGIPKTMLDGHRNVESSHSAQQATANCKKATEPSDPGVCCSSVEQIISTYCDMLNGSSPSKKDATTSRTEGVQKFGTTVLQLSPFAE